MPSGESLAAIRSAALDSRYVSMGSRRTSSVHEFYRYPARFSPSLAGAVVSAFSKPGELVLDPFVGGGTTLVEGRLLGRNAIGADINELAVFVSRAKTGLISRVTRDHVAQFAEAVGELRLRADIEWPEHLLDGSYLRHLDRADTWRIRDFVAQVLGLVPQLESGKTLARCAVLRSAQWALDMRSSVPPVEEFRKSLTSTLVQMADVARAYSLNVRRMDRKNATNTRRTTVLKAASPGLSSDPRLKRHGTPRLVLTSPPYPGVYVNYHRWKLLGRFETPAPYWIAGKLDGHGLSHYTMSARADRTLDTYFATLRAAWSDIASLGDPHTWYVQVVGFSDPAQQLRRYLKALRAAGLREVRMPRLSNAQDGRLWREVPGRRWWAVAGGRETAASHTSVEVLFVHQLAS